MFQFAHSTISPATVLQLGFDSKKSFLRGVDFRRHSCNSCLGVSPYIDQFSKNSKAHFAPLFFQSSMICPKFGSMLALYPRYLVLATTPYSAVLQVNFAASLIA